MNTEKGTKGFIAGRQPFNVGLPAWNKGVPTTVQRCPECGIFLSKTKPHVCKYVDIKGDRYCEQCGVLLKNNGYERYKKRCGRCDKKIQRDKERQLRKTLIQQFGGKCQECAYQRCEACLEFHHLDPSMKESKHFLKDVVKFPDKFRLLCNRCHRERHFLNVPNKPLTSA